MSLLYLICNKYNPDGKLDILNEHLFFEAVLNCFNTLPSLFKILISAFCSFRFSIINSPVLGFGNTETSTDLLFIKSSSTEVIVGFDNNTAVVESAGKVIVNELELTDTELCFNAFCV